MTTAQVVETLVIVTNTSFQNNTHPDNHTRQTTDTPGFKPFTKNDNGVSSVNDTGKTRQKKFRVFTIAGVEPTLAWMLLHRGTETRGSNPKVRKKYDSYLFF